MERNTDAKTCQWRFQYAERTHLPFSALKMALQFVLFGSLILLYYIVY